MSIPISTNWIEFPIRSGRRFAGSLEALRVSRPEAVGLARTNFRTKEDSTAVLVMHPRPYEQMDVFNPTLSVRRHLLIMVYPSAVLEISRC
jgi:hypothetical protein